MKYPWLDRNEYPFQSQYYAVNGYHFHYIDEGSGDVVLFIHGTPSWSFDYRHIIKELKSTHRCMAIDHIGFGLSDKPEEYDYSTQNHSATLEKFILEKNLQNITLVVHDFGGPIGLNFAIRHPERIKKLVIFNTWLWQSKDDPEFEKFSKILKSPLLPFLYKRLNFSPRFILPRSFGDHKLSKKLRKHYTQPFSNSKERNGPLAFARSLLYDQDWFEELWKKREKISSKPTLFIWGMKDQVLKPYQLEKFLSSFTNSQQVRLATAGHFPQEEQPEEVIKAVKQFLQN